jgi:sodium/hydrogen exchanger 10/11
MIQITLTFVCAYWSFVFVEGVLTLSGVLATVASSLVLAHHMWPYIVSKESMHHVWHTFESLGNILIFSLAGALTGNIVVDIDAVDYLHLIVIYVFLTILRGAIIFASRPMLRLLSSDRQPVSWQEAVVMTWGGLRGAVGLALAVSVRIDRAPDICDETQLQISEKDAERLLFFVSGIAFLTMVINAMTAPFIVQTLGITAMLEARKQLLKMFHQQLVNWSEDGNNPKEVTQALMEMLHEAEEEIDHQQVANEGDPTRAKRSFSHVSHDVLGFDEGEYQKNADIVIELEKTRNKAVNVERLVCRRRIRGCCQRVVGRRCVK